ncbi:MAG: carbamate kinase [Bacilli bacterium]
MSRIVVALGGNALGQTPEEQLAHVRMTANILKSLIEKGHLLTITHGNGPQVGAIHLAFSEGSRINNKLFVMPFPECGAMSQGYIGYHLQNALQNELGPKYPVCTLITQVEVDPDDPNFLNPTKPIGGFYTESEAKAIKIADGYVFREDASRGYRRVVASPKPIGIVEENVIKSLIDQHYTLICCGGGGIPVVRNHHQLMGVDAVIDKDYASSYLARQIDADILLILTTVSYVSLHYHTENEVLLRKLTTTQARTFIEEGHFAKGSMLPKVEASMEFVAGNPHREAIITSLEEASKALSGECGTHIYEEELNEKRKD